jgi:hypothetical protein
MEPSGKVNVIETLSSLYLPPSGQGVCCDGDGSRANEEGDEVNKVTGLADDSSAADSWVLSPVSGREVACVDAVVGVEGRPET